MNGNYIKIYRSLLDWEWYSDINTCRLFIHMLLKANWKDGKFRGSTIPRGSFVSSIRNLADETKLTEREVRTAISHLKSTGELTSKTHSKYSVFTIKNYESYQVSDTHIDSQSPIKRQPNDIQTTTIEERKKERRKENNNTVRFAPPDVNMVRDYCIERNNSVDPQSFVDFYTAKGWMVGKNKMKDWKAAVRTWERNHTGSKAKKNGFNNFSGRDYDMANLERQLIE